MIFSSFKVSIGSLLLLYVLFLSSFNVSTEISQSNEAKNISELLLEEYHNYNVMKEILQSFQSTFHKISKLYSIGKSVQHRDLLVFQISDNVDTVEPGEPMFKYVANIHGDETVGREMLISLIYHLLSNYGKDERITRLINTTNIFIMPSANPDGFERVKEGSCDNSLGRYNAHNIDLNRNFPDQFDKGVTKQNMFKDREVETVSLMNWILENKFVLSANLHGGAVVASYPFDDSASHQHENYYSRSPDDALFRHLALVYSKSHKTMHQGNLCAIPFDNGITNGANWYDVPGGMQDFNYIYSNCFEITLELSCCKYPLASNLKNEWENNREALINYMEQVHIGAKGFVSEAADSDKPNSDGIYGTPIQNAIISVEGIEHDVTTSRYGDYWRLLLPGQYKLTARANGFLSQTKTVIVKENEPVQVNFTLSRDETHSNNNNKKESEEKELEILVSQINLLLDAEKRDSLLLNTINVNPAVFKHHNNEELIEFLRHIKEKCPSITSVYSVGQSVNGTNIYAIIISDNPLVHEAGEPELKYIGNMHGDEVLGRELLLQLISFLCENYGKSELVTRLVDLTRIHIVPTMNPDGYELKTRSNKNNIDLNRNFPSIFSQTLDDKMQPETSSIIKWSQLYPFVLSANFHSGSLVVNYPYDDNKESKITNSPTPDDETFKMISKAYSLAHAKMSKNDAPCVRNDNFKDGITNGAAWYTGNLK
jgi:carboxypeptidase D